MRLLLNLLLFSISLGVLAVAAAAQAQASGPIDVQARGGVLEFVLTEPQLPHAGAKLIITGPDGYSRGRHFEAGEAMYFSPVLEGAASSGRFRYELRLQAIEEPRAGMGMPQARPIPLSTSRGAFTLDNGSIVNAAAEESTRAIVVPDDQSIQGSLCVGLDCTSSESFADFSVLTLKENNTRIRFQDTSNSAAFPSTDWELRANDTTNGGANQFAITDYSANREVLILEGGAPESALYIDDQGQTGFGTATPLLKLHVVDNNTPAIRLDQDGTGGFEAQSWDMGGNEVEYFVRDATNLTVPFSIVAGAPTDALVVDGSGRVGMGVLSPERNLHLRTSAGSAGIRLESGSSSWDAGASSDGFTIDQNGSAGTELRVSPAGDLSVAGSLTSLAAVDLPRVSADQNGPSMSDIESYIQRHGQLPGIEQGNEGHDVVQFQMQLLEAVQQLTLQNIEQQKEIEALRRQIGRKGR